MAKPPETRLSRLLASKAFESIQKQFGSSAITLATEKKVDLVPRLSSHILQLDYALGGGWPIGRINTIYGHKSTGKSTLCTLAVASAQRTCRNCLTPVGIEGKCQCGEFADMSVVYIDVEGTYEGTWGRNLGCDPEKLLLSRPDHAEQALDILEALIRSRECDVIILDSIAFLTPAKEIEKSVSEDMVGAQARVSGKAVRKFVSAMNAVGNMSGDCWKPTIFLTNQLRMKVGLLFGCFHHDTPVMFVDGSQVPIGRVVKEKLGGPVLSWDGEKIVERRITAWHENGPLGSSERWLTFKTEGSGGRRGAMGFTCTPNHVLVQADGKEIEARSVGVGTRLMSWFESTLTKVEREILIGSMFGDGHIMEHGSLHLSNSEQLEYLLWKLGHFNSLGFFRGESSGRRSFRSGNTEELRLYREVFYGSASDGSKNYRSIPLELLREASSRSLAVWWCDDGCYFENRPDRGILSVKRLSSEQGKLVAEVLARKYPGVVYRESQKALVFQEGAFDCLAKDIVGYVPKCMAYKLPQKYREHAVAEPITDVPELKRIPVPVRVLSVRDSRKKHKSRTKYDLTIEGDSFYLVGGDSRGVVVHNSPETQPGGLAWGFAASNEVRVNQGKYKMDEESGRPLYVDIPFKVDKNKCLRGSERVFLPDVGRFISVEELARRDRQTGVLSVSEGTGRVQRAEMVKCWRQPEVDVVYEVSLDTGEVLGANVEHRLLTPVGWLRVGDLHVGQWVAVPKRIPVMKWEGIVEPPLLRACLLGLLAGGGYVGGKTGVYLINEDPLVVSRLREAVEEFGCEVYRKPDSPLHWEIRQKGGGHKGSENPLYTWLREVHMWGCQAWEKELPPEVFGWSEQVRGALLGGLFATGGRVKAQKNGSLRVGFTSTSRTLSEQVQQLLLTAGIRFKLSEVRVPKKLGYVGSHKIKSLRPAWRVVVSSDEMVSRFRSLVPWMGSKIFVDYPELRGRGGRSDRIPTALADNAEFFVRGSVFCADVARVLGFEDPEGESWDRVLRRRKDYISLRSLRAWASLVPVVPKEIQELLDSDLAWSRVRKIENVGVEPVYDLSVPGMENLIVSGMVAHNTAVPKMEGNFRMMLSDTETKLKGQIADEGYIVAQLERLGVLTGSGSSWKIGDRSWKGKIHIERQLETDPEFGYEMRALLMAVLLAA